MDWIGEEELHSGADAAHGAAGRRRDGGGGSMSQGGHHRTTFYKWKRRVAGMGTAELARLRQLEDENKKLKALVALIRPLISMLQEVLRKEF